MATFTTTATVNDLSVSELPDYRTRLRRARLGLLVALTPVLMLFVSFTSAYVVRQGLPTLDPGTNQLVRDWIPVKLPVLLVVNTCVLLLSSVGMELARRQTHRALAVVSRATEASVTEREKEQVPWLAMTVVLGLLFLYGQWMAWRQLAARGFYVSTTPSSSFVYLLTGTHAVHLMGGVLALLVAGVFALLRRPVTTRSIVVDVTAWYWHFMAVLWVYIFCLLEFVS
jgi:cytochrome c oxidase subunit 3